MSHFRDMRYVITANRIIEVLTTYVPGGGPSLDSLLLYLTLSVVLFVVIYMIASR